MIISFFSVSVELYHFDSVKMFKIYEALLFLVSKQMKFQWDDKS